MVAARAVIDTIYNGGFSGTWYGSDGKLRDTFGSHWVPGYETQAYYVQQAMDLAGAGAAAVTYGVSEIYIPQSTYDNNKSYIDQWISAHPNIHVFIGSSDITAQIQAQAATLAAQQVAAEAAQQAALKAAMLTSPTAQFASSPTNITVQISKQGSGKVLSSGGDNALAERSSITVPSGYKVYLQAVPANGVSFVKFTGSGGETTQNPFEVPVTTDGSITAVFSDAPGQGQGILGILQNDVSGAVQYALGAAHNIVSTVQNDATAAAQTVQNAVIGGAGDAASLAAAAQAAAGNAINAASQAVTGAGKAAIGAVTGGQTVHAQVQAQAQAAPAATQQSATTAEQSQQKQNDQIIIAVLVVVVVLIIIGILANAKKRG